MWTRAITASVSLLLASSNVFAQIDRQPAVEGIVGHAAFVDEDPIDHLVAGGAFRYPVSPRVSVGPEVVFMDGPNLDRDLFITGNIWFDFVAPRPDRMRRATVYLVAGAGLMRHHDAFVPDFVSHEGAVTGGIGVRVAVNDRWYIAPEARLGWEPHTRVSVSIGYRFDR